MPCSSQNNVLAIIRLHSTCFQRPSSPPPRFPAPRSFVAAGTDTTSSALAFAIYLLATNPAKEAALLAEVDALGGRTPAAHAELAAALPYTHAALTEAVRGRGVGAGCGFGRVGARPPPCARGLIAYVLRNGCRLNVPNPSPRPPSRPAQLRLLPPGNVTLRTLREPTRLGPYALPAGQRVMVSQYAMQRSALYWGPDALAFVPERHVAVAAPDAGGGAAALLPFGDGARRCPGYAFATQEAALALCRLYQRFTFRPAPGFKLETLTTIAMGPKDGLRVVVRPRA